MGGVKTSRFGLSLEEERNIGEEEEEGRGPA